MSQNAAESPMVGVLRAVRADLAVTGHAQQQGGASFGHVSGGPPPGYETPVDGDGNDVDFCITEVDSTETGRVTYTG